MRLSDMRRPRQRARAIRRLILPLCALTADEEMWRMLQGGRWSETAIRRCTPDLSRVASVLRQGSQDGDWAVLRDAADRELALLMRLCREYPPGILLPLARQCDSVEELDALVRAYRTGEERLAWMSAAVSCLVRDMHILAGGGALSLPPWPAAGPVRQAATGKGRMDLLRRLTQQERREKYAQQWEQSGCRGGAGGTAAGAAGGAGADSAPPVDGSGG